MGVYKTESNKWTNKFIFIFLISLFLNYSVHLILLY